MDKALSLRARFARLVRQLGRSEKGNVAVIFAVSLPMVVGGLGYGVETSYWYLTRQRMQGAADAAAHAGAMEARTGAGYDNVLAASSRAAADNGMTTAATITVHVPPTSGPSAGSNRAVEVILHRDIDRVFTGIFLDGDVSLETRAVATYNSAATACILALHPTASASAKFSGATNVGLNGCSVMSNSVANDAFLLQGSAALSTECVISVGGVQSTSNLTLNDCEEAVTNAAPAADPFKEIAPPTPPLPCQNGNGSTLSPGRYCNGLQLRNNKTLSPGIYYIEGGDLKVNANANISGSGVTIYLAPGANVDMAGNAKVVLSAPTTGTYKGMLFFGARNGAGQNKFNGTADSLLTGAIYFKNQHVDYAGNFSGVGGCTQVVARTIEWTGSTTINADCSSLGMTPIPAQMTVKLTE